ncbi:hypothetical protein DFH08DRAFT_459421 [Mycena albidolilacea]|uniref:F-box domain-containing protein n=1 Tax=Mycena albidolilacea TaxID=1033008 RepID=A0AAD7EZI6_9AGAR|nr:hypothetical protein DFH08DRAFT_459421 [Mycena albidolilacea]
MFSGLADCELDRARLTDIDAQILDLERSILALRSQKRLVLERLASYSYPVSTLSNEITVEIFKHFLPIYPRCPTLLGLDSPARICRRWREITLTTPTLWQAISIYPQLAFEHQLDLCNSWLGRSRSYPLELELSEDAIDILHRTEVLSAVTSHRARWELNLSPSRVRAIEGPLPLLRSLNLLLVDDEFATEVSFPEVPVLHTVVLNDIAAASLILSWAQLT